MSFITIMKVGFIKIVVSGCPYCGELLLKYLMYESTWTQVLFDSGFFHLKKHLGLDKCFSSS